MIVLVILGVFLAIIALIEFQGYYQERKYIKNNEEFITNIVKHVPCPKCVSNHKNQELRFIGEYKIFLKCEVCNNEWYTTYK